MKKIWGWIVAGIIAAGNIVALLFIWDSSKRYEITKEIEEKAKEAREKKKDEIKIKPATVVYNDYLSDDNKSDLDDIRADAVQDLINKSRSRADNNKRPGP